MKFISTIDCSEMSTNIDNDNVECVEYLEGDYEENQEIVTIDVDNLQQVEYFEAEQVKNYFLYFS